MFIKDFKKAEIDLKILQRDRRAANIEWQRCVGLWEKTSGQWDKEDARRAAEKRRNAIEWERTKGEWERTLGQFEKDEVNYNNTMEWSPYMKVKRFLDESYPEYASNLLDSITDGQYESKRWMCQILKPELFGSKDSFKIEIVGAWFGWPLIEMLEDTIVRIEQIDLYDPDEVCQEVVQKYKYHFEPSYNINQFGDYFERNDKRIRHMIICTSCEHMPDIGEMKEYYKDTPKPIYVLQSNDYIDLPEHENCVESTNELAEKNGISDIMYKGEKDFGYYKRFMVVGRW